ncbi:MAG: CxxC-x17-CxxC domain-containing protein [Bradymonadia bacterium]|jgi:CxxC-x17-CxxC domain-containing protein
MAKRNDKPVEAVTRPRSSKIRTSERRAKTPSVPRLLHNTRVAFRITCSRCDTDATLPFVPKTEGALLCPSCAEDEFGPEWARGRDKGGQKVKRSFPCATCSAPVETTRTAEESTGLLCRACHCGEEASHPERISGTVLDPALGVLKKRRRKL